MNTRNVEELLSISKQTLAYYEKMGFVSPKRDINNYRNYCQEDIDKIRYVQLLRSFEISIKDIQLILSGDKSIKDILKLKKDFIKNTKIQLDNIDNKIKEFIKRKRVKVSFDYNCDKNKFSNELLYFEQDQLVYCDDIISIKSITSVNISMSSSQGDKGLYFFILSYYIDVDIYLQDKIYSFQIMNNDMIKKIFDYFSERQIKISDPLNLNELYHEIIDSVELNKYINRHFNKWAKTYNLDNPRDNYYTITKTYYNNYINERKSQLQPTIRGEFKLFFKLYYDIVKRVAGKLKNIINK